MKIISIYLLLTKIIYLSAPKNVEKASRFNGDLPSLFFSIALTIFFATIEIRLDDRKKNKGDDTDHADKKKESDQRKRRKNQAK